MAIACLLLLALISLVGSIVVLFERGWPIGMAAALALLVFMGSVAMAIQRESASFRRLREATTYQLLFSDDVSPTHLSRQREVLIEMLTKLPIAPEIAASATTAVAGIGDISRAIDFVESAVVRELDRKALDRVRTAVWHSFGLIALSPTSITDTALFVWRALRLVREVGSVYGLRPNRFGSFWLLRQVLSDAALITAADLAADALGTVLGEKLASRLSSPLAEGSLASYRMARFGLLAIQRCRPIAFRKDDQLGLYTILRNKGQAAAASMDAKTP